MAADDERAVELFHSDAKGKRSFFKAVLSGTELVTVTGKVGSKGRTTTKSLPDLDAAAKAFDRAVGKKAKAGFYPEWGFEHPFELDADDPPDRTRTLELRDAESPRDRPSRQQLAIVGQNRTLDYREGPHDWGLWTNAGHLQVSRDHDFNDVEPRLPGIFSSPLYSGAPTSRLDGATVAFVYGGSIVEVDLAAATQRTRHEFEAPPRIDLLLSFGNDDMLFWRTQEHIVRQRGTEAPLVLWTTPSTARGIAPLSGGHLAVLLADELVVLDGEGEPRLRLPTYKGRWLGRWLDGRVLTVSMDVWDGDRRTVVLAVDEDGALYEAASLPTNLVEAHDRFGRQWGREKRQPSRERFVRAYNVDLAWEHAIRASPIDDGTPLATRPRPKDSPATAPTNKPPPNKEERRRRLKEAAAERQTQRNEAFAACFEAPSANLEKATELHAKGVNVDAVHRGLSALRWATFNHNAEAVAWLLDRGASLAPNTDNRTPLLTAAQKGFDDLVDVFLERGTDPSQSARDGSVGALAVALVHGHDAIATRLLEAGADRLGSGFTPLMAAAAGDRARWVEKLLEAGADRHQTAVNPFERGRMTRSAQGHAETAGAMKALAALRMTSDAPAATLHEALKAGDASRVKELIAAGADVEEPGERSTRPLHLAASRSLDLVAPLLAAGADPNVTNDFGGTPLGYVGYGDDGAERAEALLAAGANLTGAGGALLKAVEDGRHRLALVLLEAGVSVETQGRQGRRLLHVAAERDDVEMLDVLWRAEPKLRSIYTTIHGERHTPLHTAAGHNAAEAAVWLMSKGASPNHDGDWPKKARSLDHDHYYNHGRWTPIHVAAAVGAFDVLVALLRRSKKKDWLATTAAGVRADALADGPCHALLDAILNRGQSLEAALESSPTPRGAPES